MAIPGIVDCRPQRRVTRQQPSAARLSVTVHDIHGNMTVMME